MPDRSELWRRVDSIWLDVALTGALAMVPLLALAETRDLAFLFDLALIAPLVLRRRAPVGVFTLVSLLLLTQATIAAAPRFGDVAILLALHAIASHGPRWAMWAGLATGFLGAAIAAVRWSGVGLTDPGAIVFVFVLVGTAVFAAWLLGLLARTRRAYVSGLEERAVQLERDALQQARIATDAERARIAREMHDVVAHSISVIVVQADGALYAADKRPEVAVETLRTISATGRTSLAEMRQLLGVLRNDSDAAELAPVAEASDIPALVEQLRGSGLAIGLSVSGDLSRIDRPTGLTAYRIVQEALTNTLKHGGPGVTAEVDLRVTSNAVRVRVDDDGRGGGTTDDGQGHGILGIRERIALHHGEVEAGPRPGGGFRVDAVVPFRQEVPR